MTNDVKYPDTHPMMTGSEIRETFLRYFEQQGHRRVPSSSLVPPANDPTLLFTNAGMNQFKDVFLGLEKRDYTRAASSQKCVRAGGKHNDLENVGFTRRHHTFFEMLGNFSFGDYFKRDAIRFAWELVTAPAWYAMPRDKLYCTIFKGEQGVPRDDEAFDCWREQGVAPDRIFELGMKDNFWAMGDTGPCGPCSEIHYDMGPAASDLGHADCKFPCDCGRYVEIWNLVFMQFDRDAGGTLNPLPKPCVDTGMGLDRTAAVLQGVVSNYDTDLFQPLIARAAELTGTDLKRELEEEEHKRSAASLRVIVDHARATTFLIADGVVPSNEGRGYVLRKIIRRAIRHGRLLGHDKPFLHEMVYAVRDLMKDAYPELVESADRVAQMVKGEETRFAHTLKIGLQKLEEALEYPLKEKQRIGFGWLLGEEAFRLYDTYGLPLDFIQDACRDLGIDLNIEDFESAMAAQRALAQASWKGTAKKTASPAYTKFLDEFYKPVAIGTGKMHGETVDVYSSSFREQSEFVGYKTTEASGCEVVVILKNAGESPASTQVLKAGEQGELVLDETPFYAEAGGQVGDVGWLYSDDRNTLVADVTGCYAPVQGVRAHRVTARQNLVVGDRVTAIVNADVRRETMRNHTATHLVHAALRNVLGTHVKQAGSLVDPQHLRFDFSHFAAVEDEQLQDIEDLANRQVLANQRVEVIEDVPIDVAINEYKAMALFGEKYGDKVRVIKIGDFSTELCGGTHTAATGEIGLVKILREQSVSAGVRRLEAVTGEGSLRHFRADHALEHVARALVRPGEQEGSLATALQREMDGRDEEIKRLRRELEQARMKSAAAGAQNIDEKIRVIHGVKVLAHRADNLERPQLRTW